MSESERWNTYWPKPTLAAIDVIAHERGVSRKQVLVDALSLYRAAHEAAKDGKPVGIPRRPEDLEKVLVLPVGG